MLFDAFFLVVGDSVDGDFLAGLAMAFEFDDAGDGREQGVIAAFLDVVARLHLGSSLTIEDAASGHDLPVGGFRSKATSSGIASVFGGANAFLRSEELNIKDEFHSCYFLSLMLIASG